MVNLIAYLSGQNTAGKLQLEAQAHTKKKPVRSLKGKAGYVFKARNYPSL